MEEHSESIWTKDITPHVVAFLTTDITPDFKSSFWQQDVSGHVLLTLAMFGLVVSAGFATLTVAAAGVNVQLALAGQPSQAAAAAAALPDDYGTGTPAVSKYPAYCPRLSQTMQIGSRDLTTSPQGQVSELQHFISGYYNIAPSEIMTSYFGTITQSFVIRFQQEQGLPAQGIVGQLTRAAIAQLCGGSSTIGFVGARIQAGVEPSNAVASQAGQRVAFTTFTITTGVQSVSLGSIGVQLTGTASDAALADVVVTYAEAMGSAHAVIGPNHTANVYLTDPVLLPANSTFHFTVWGDMALNVSQDTGKTIGLAVVSVNTNSTVSGTLPITGATNTISSAAVKPTVGSLNISVDASSPSYQLVAGGTSGVVAGVYKLTASGEPVNLTKIGLTLTSGSASDLAGVHLYSASGLLLGTATFVGNSMVATSILSSPVTIPQDATLQIIVKADISAIGTGQPGTAGDLIKVDPSNFQAVGANSGVNIAGSATAGVAGVRIFKSYPTVALLSSPSSLTGSAGNQPILMRYSVTASPNGPVSVGSNLFSVAATAGISFSDVSLYAYTDSGFSQPISSLPSGKIFSCTGGCPGSTFTTGGGGSAGVMIPAGSTYYFQLLGTPSSLPTSGSFSVTTTLLGDAAYQPLSAYSSIANTSHFMWSPNDTTAALPGTSDWTNGYGVTGLPAAGLTQTITGSGATVPAPIISNPITIACPSNYLSGGICTLSHVLVTHSLNGRSAIFASFVRPGLAYAINFGDGTEFQIPTCTLPYSGQPNSCGDAGYISHTYAKAGTYSVQVLNYACVGLTSCSVVVDSTSLTVN